MSVSGEDQAHESDADRDDARSQVFARMRNALKSGQAPDAKATIRAKLASSAPTIIPARANLDAAGRVRLFIDQAKAVQADVERIASYADLEATIAGYLRGRNLPMRLTRAVDKRRDIVDQEGSLLDIRAGAPTPDDPVGLTTAFAGIAETGTLMLTSDQDHPTMLAFLPETAIVVLPSDRVARAYEDAVHAFRGSGRALPRSINLVTGPSRSGDIEQTLQLGAHGPKRLLIVLVDEPSEEGPIADVDVLDPHR